VLAYHFKTGVDCFFAVWFVVGNVWIFGGRSISSDAQDAPNMYRYLHCSLFLLLSVEFTRDLAPFRQVVFGIPCA
jgi:hypothetical protein